jgi:NosR/NirI family nitrous oxide reductase transcriptional regulator
MRALSMFLRLFGLPLPLLLLMAAGQARASVYSAELSEQLLHGPDLCAEAPCRDVMPQAQRFSLRKGNPSYVEAIALGPGQRERVAGYVFLSTDVVDIPAYSGKPIVTLIGMDTRGIITGVRVLKHSEPILLAGIDESTLLKFIGQYIGKAGDAKLDIGHGDEAGGTVGLDAISGATVTVIAENQVISRSAYEIGRQVGIFKGEARPAPRYTALNERLSWQQLLDEGSVVHFPLQRKQVGLAGEARHIDMYFGHLNVPTVGISLLGEPVYRRLMADLKPDEQAIFIIANGEASFKGSGFVRGGIYDRVQVRQDPQGFTFRDTDYLNLYGLHAPGAPAFTESAVFIVRSASFNPAWPWQLTFLANKADPQSGAKTFIHFNAPYWLPARYLEGGRPHIVQPEATWRAIWHARTVQIALFLLVLGFTALMYAQRDRLVRASTRKHKPWIARPRHALWLVSVAFLGFYLKAQPSITQVLTWFHSLLHQWRWELFLSDPFIFLFWWFIIVSVLVWGRGVFCGWLCPFGSLQQLALSLGKAVGLARFQRLLPKPLHDKLKWIKYALFALLLGLSLHSMELAEQLAEVEPFKTTFIVGVWNRSWPFWVFIGAILGCSFLSERPYCKYLCPLGAGLALPGKFRLFGLRRKAECRTCHACAAGCGSHAIDSAGRIDPMECMLCLDCMILYYDDHACPPLVKERKLRERHGDALTPIDAAGYFIALDAVRAALKARAAAPAEDRQ